MNFYNLIASYKINKNGYVDMAQIYAKINLCLIYGLERKMFKQVYRFLSIILISNLLFGPAVFSQPQQDTKKTGDSVEACQKKTKHKKQNKKPIAQNNNNSNNYVTKYGVYFDDDAFDTYPTPTPTPTVKPINDDNNYVTKYGVMFDDDIKDTYPAPAVQPNPKND